MSTRKSKEVSAREVGASGGLTEGAEGRAPGADEAVDAAAANDQPGVPAAPHGAGPGDYIDLNGKRLTLRRHATDFTVIGPSDALAEAVSGNKAETHRLSSRIVRASAAAAADRDSLMEAVRDEAVAHHVYEVADTEEEIVIDNRIFLTLRNEDPEALEQLIEEFKLVPEGRMGNAHVLRVTEATGMNPLKTANEIAQREGVASCTPQLLVPMLLHQTDLTSTHRLFRRQWYLTSELMASPDLKPTAGVRAPEAWKITTGSPDIVIAVIDDGFDLDHPAFRNKRIHKARRDFAVAPQDEDPVSEADDYHGTCVASIATGSLGGDGMIGVAPGCTLLPVRLGFGPMAAQVDILEVFRYVSRFADVVNCSFGTSPTSFDIFNPEFRNAITELTRTGGRRGKGLVMVFSASNDDAPTFLRASQNKNGVSFVRPTQSGAVIDRIPPGRDVFSGYPMTRGVITVGAMSSLKRKSGYSCWGPHLTVTAPSNNLHYITSFIPKGANDAVRNKFVANYRGLGQIAATNRPGKGDPFDPLLDDLATPDFSENFYTGGFGGTSGAAPVVAGVAALMLSVNPNLTAEQVRQILMATADRELDTTLDLKNDPNVQGLSGKFVNGMSLFFGAGKVDALRAVQRAQSLLGPQILPQPAASVAASAPLSAPTHGWPDFLHLGDEAAHHNGSAPSPFVPEAGAAPRGSLGRAASSVAGVASSVGTASFAATLSEAQVLQGSVHYSGATAQLVGAGAARVLIEFRDDGQYDFALHARAARDFVRDVLGKGEGDTVGAQGHTGSVGLTPCLFYTSIW